MTTSRADLPVVLDRDRPLAAQITGQLRDAITSGVLLAEERLPSTRELAATLGVSRTVVTSAYAQLFAEGWIEGRHGSGTYVADVTPGLPPLAPAVPSASGEPPGPSSGGVPPAQAPPPSACLPAGDKGGRIQMLPGVPWADGIDPALWRRAWRYAGTRPPSSWPDVCGLPELRAELVTYLRRSRALTVTADHILVTRGVSNGLTGLAATLIKPGDRAGVEEPGYRAAREVLRRAGAQVVPCRVDEHGVVPEELPAGLRLLYTTPAHQYPLGGRLPVARRQALVAWARRTGTVIVEDDYDGEFRYDVAPLPALAAMDSGVVVYLGTTSKTLTPVLGAGWLVAAPGLVDRIAADRQEISERVPEPVQHALVQMITSGALERHVRRMRLEYARRRSALMDLPGVIGDTAGMHVVVELPPDRPASEVASAARDLGVDVSTLERYYAGPPDRNGLALGYGAVPLPGVRRAAALLGPLLAP
jgi:GntR family transcriptional regulator/MocR family aminotransferase